MTNDEALVHMTRYALEGKAADAAMLAGMQCRRNERAGNVKTAEALRALLVRHPNLNGLLREHQAAAEARGWDSTGGGDEPR